MADSKLPSNDPVTPVKVTRAGEGGMLRGGDKGGLGKKETLDDLDLATGIDRLPQYWSRHGNKFLIGLTILALGYSLWSFKRNSAISATVSAQNNLAQARELVMQLRLFGLERTPERYATLRRSALSEGTTFLNEVLGQTDDDNAIVQALLIRGDLNYILASMPEMQAATTREALRLPQKPEALLTSARDSYAKVISSYSTRKWEVGAARFGLATIAEDTGQFDEAKKQYDAILADATQISSYRDVATARLKRIPDLERPLRLRTAASQPVMPGLGGLTPPLPGSALSGFGTPGMLPTTSPAAGNPPPLTTSPALAAPSTAP